MARFEVCGELPAVGVESLGRIVCGAVMCVAVRALPCAECGGRKVLRKQVQVQACIVCAVRAVNFNR